MEISRMLLKPFLERLEIEYRSLDLELGLHPATPEIVQLKVILHKKFRQLEMLNVSVSYMDDMPGALDPQDLQASLKRLKLELRFARRKYKRLISNESRFRKIQEKRTHVSTVAA